MSNVVTNYLYFDVKNYAGSFSVSGYSLPITDFTFIPRLDSVEDVSNKRLVWDFGDGTTSKELTAVHNYSFPGTYTVSMYLYESGGVSDYNILSRSIFVYDYITDNISLSAQSFTLTANHIDVPINVYRSNSWQTYAALSAEGYTIALDVSGAPCPLVSSAEYYADKYAHLRSLCKFYEKVYNYGLGAYEDSLISTINVDGDEIYVTLDGSNIVHCEQGTVNSCFAGTTGNKIVYFVSDLATDPNEPLLVSASFNTEKFLTPQTYNLEDPMYEVYSILQTVAQTIYFDVVADDPNHLTITSNGIDDTSIFNINVNQFQDRLIPFVIRVSDTHGYPCKQFNLLNAITTSNELSSNSLHVVLMSAGNILASTITDNFGSLSSLSNGGFYSGVMTYSAVATNVSISAEGLVDSTRIYGNSSLFDIIDDDGKYYIAKKNEDVDFTELYKDYRFQESLLDKSIFFDNFLGTMVGNISSTGETLGKKVYEKISNFVDNTMNVDTCNVSQFYSLKSLMDIDLQQFDSYDFTAPAGIGRWIDMFSIKQSELWGGRNQFASNFDKKGTTTNTFYGINLGDEIFPETAILTAGPYSTNIVAFEKFSSKFLLINTDMLSAQYVTFIDPVKMTYALSAYRNDWNWGLILPQTFDGTDLNKYYRFYTYISTPESTQLEGVINWQDITTTLSESNSSHSGWASANGIIAAILNHQLSVGLSLFGPATGLISRPLVPGATYTYYRPGGGTYIRYDVSGVYYRP